MCQEALRQVLERLDAPSGDAAGPTFRADELSNWSSGAVEQLVGLGLLEEAAPSQSVYCDGCEDACLEDVVWGHNAGDMSPRAYVVCKKREDVGRVLVSKGTLRRWRISALRLVEKVAFLLNTGSPVEEVVHDRLWYLGHTRFNQRRADLFFCRGGAWSDAEVVLRPRGRLAECSMPVILVPSEIPPNFLALGKVFSLRRLLSLEGGNLQIDLAEMEGALGKARARRTQVVAPFRVPDGTKWEDLTIEFVNEETVKIEVGTIVEHRDFIEMGFQDKRKPADRPDQLWTILRMFAKREGRIEWTSRPDVSVTEIAKLKKGTSDIRTRLRAVFPQISGDPFHPYRKVHAYETRFKLRSRI